jgi:hypothetical protein
MTANQQITSTNFPDMLSSGLYDMHDHVKQVYCTEAFT